MKFRICETIVICQKHSTNLVRYFGQKAFVFALMLLTWSQAKAQLFEPGFLINGKSYPGAILEKLERGQAIFDIGKEKKIRASLVDLKKSELEIICRKVLESIETMGAAEKKKLFANLKSRSWLIDGKRLKAKLTTADHMITIEYRTSRNSRLTNRKVSVVQMSRNDLVYVLRSIGTSYRPPADAKPVAKGGLKEFRLRPTEKGSAFQAVRLDRESLTIVSIDSNKKMAWYSAKDGKLLQSKQMDSKIESYHLGPKGRWIITTSPSEDKNRSVTTELWSTRSGEKLRQFRGTAKSVSFDPSGNTIAVLQNLDFPGADRDKVRQRMVFWNLEKNSEFKWDTVTGIVTEPCEQIVLSPNARWLFQIDQMGNFMLREVRTKNELKLDVARLTRFPDSDGVLFSPDSQSILFSRQGVHHVFDLERKRMIEKFKTDADQLSKFSRFFGKENEYLFGRGEKGKLAVWDRKSGKLVTWIAHRDGVDCAEVSPDGKYLITTNLEGMETFVWDLGDRKKVAALKPSLLRTKPIQELKFGRKNQRIFCSSGIQVECYNLNALIEEYKNRLVAAKGDDKKGPAAKKPILVGKNSDHRRKAALRPLPAEANGLAIWRSKPLDRDDLNEETNYRVLWQYATNSVVALNFFARAGSQKDFETLGQTEMAGVYATGWPNTNGFGRASQKNPAEITFVQYEKPIDIESLKKLLSKKFRGDGIVERTVDEKTFLVSENGKFAVYMPSPNSMHFSTQVEAIKKLVVDDELEPSKLAAQAIVATQSNQLFIHVDRKVIRTYSLFLYSVSSPPEDSEHVPEEYKEWAQELTPTILLLNGNVTQVSAWVDKERIQIMLECDDEANAKKLREKLPKFLKLAICWFRLFLFENPEEATASCETLFDSIQLERKDDQITFELSQKALSKFLGEIEKLKSKHFFEP